MKTVLVLMFVFMLFGCASLNNAGTASYVVRPFADGKGELHCCEVIVNNGKEIAALDARIEAHPGSHYIVELHERGVAAFVGQKIAADVAGEVIKIVPVAIP